MNFSRFFNLAERGTLVCNPLLLKTAEREKILTYSNPFKPAYAHILVSRHPVSHMPAGLSLKNFLKDDDHAMIVQNKRSYGPLLDQLIKEAKESGRIKEHSFATKQLFIMLENGRIEHFVDIENSATYFASLHEGQKRFYNIPLEEDRLDRFGYAVCSKTPAGEKLINRINQIIRKAAPTKEFRDILESWMADENKNRFRLFYDREILKK